MDNYPIINQLIDDKEKVTELARKYHLEVVRNPVQMIEGNGTFCESNVEKFVESATNLLAPGESYAIISIIGPQSSGKSFLLNQLFGTNFDMMNATKGRSQTTKGILLGQSQSSKSCALIMDVEGSDGRERGDDDVSFERQSALFALTVSDIMMINMWVYDIGRQQGGVNPLLRTVFQERVKLDSGKTKVLVVVRDYDDETPFETLENDILTTMEEIWMSVHDRPNGTAVQFSHYIEVMVVALPHKALKREFEKEVTKLREWFAKENIVGLRQDRNSTSEFSFSAKSIWKAIKQNKQLDLPSHKLAVSKYVCERVAKECLAAAIRDENFERLNDAASSDEFIVKLEALLQNCVTRYDKDTEMSDETQRDAKRDVLKEKILQAAEPFANKLLNIIRSKFFYEVKDKVTALLDKADDPPMKMPTIVEDFLELFIKSCGGLESKYKSLCLENCNMLRNELTYHARSKTLHIKLSSKKNHNSIINQLIDDKEKMTGLAREYHHEVVRNPVQMIEGNGTFCESNVEKFVKSATNLLAPGESYAIISIIGPQSSGKSFLLNQVFGTNFDVMNAMQRRSQTTKGILLAQSQSSKHCALIMDVEGSDGRERGDDDVSFERQSALFALTMSDIMMINMWLHDIGRQQGGSVPILRTVFQVRVKLDPGKTKVLVVVRDYNDEPPFETLKQDVLITMEEIWMSVHDRPNGTAVQFSHYIEVMVVALPPKAQKREFEKEVTELREWFAKENIVGLRHDKNSTSGFSFSAKKLWEEIKQNKQLDILSHKECLAAAIRDEDFERLNYAGSPDEFIVKLEALLQNCVIRYDQDSEMSDETQRDTKRDALKEKILQAAEPFANKLLNIIRSKFFNEEKDKVTALLDKADDPAMEIPTIVEVFLELFTKSCGGLESKYKPLCLENCNMLRNELTYHARSKTLHIKEQRMKEELDRAKAEAERFKVEAKLEREEALEKIERKLQELKRATEEARRAAQSAEDAKKKADRAAQEIKGKAEAAARNSRSERSSWMKAMLLGASILTGLPIYSIVTAFRTFARGQGEHERGRAIEGCAATEDLDFAGGQGEHEGGWAIEGCAATEDLDFA